MEAHLRTCPTRLRVERLQAQSYYKAGTDAASHLPASQLCREVSQPSLWGRGTAAADVSGSTALH